MRSWWALAAVAAILLPGCSGGGSGGDGSPTDRVRVITDPSQNRTGLGPGAHLHDYWGGSDTRPVQDAEMEIDGILWFGEPIPIASFRPEPGDVVPQGADRVDVTIEWTDSDPLNGYAEPQLWVKTAADNATRLLAAVESGDTVSVPTGNGDNDLPHQVLSAWQFDVVMAGTPMPDGGTLLTYTGTVHLVAVAHRGFEIPLYPGHPDRWGNATEIELFSAEVELFYDGDPTGGWRCYGGCPVIHVPANGTIVPVDADRVEVTLDAEADAPTMLGLKVHGADSREWTVVEADHDSPEGRVYVIPVEMAGDGPYARQSQWEFAPYPATPVEDGFVRDTYTIRAVAYRIPLVQST